MTKTIQVSFRLTPWQLAHGLEIIQNLEPSYQPASLSAMAKIIYQDWLSKLSIGVNPEPSNQSLARVQALNNSWKQKAQFELDSNQELQQIIRNQGIKANKTINKANPPAKVSNSVRTIVTDFSPPSAEELSK